MVACRAQLMRAGTLPMSRRTLLLLMSARQDRFLRMLETTWWSSSLSDSSWATSAARQLRLEHSVACRDRERLHILWWSSTTLLVTPTPPCHERLRFIGHLDSEQQTQDSRVRGHRDSA